MLSASSFGFSDLADAIEGDIARAATAAMRETAERTRDELREQTRSVGLGDKLPKTWTARAYPAGEKGSINPAGVVYSRAPDIMEAFTRGATIRPVAGAKYLWIPTDNVPRARSRSGRFARDADGKMSARRFRAGALTPEECESRFNTDFILRRSKAGRLLAFMELVKSRNGRSVRSVTTRRVSAGRAPKLTLMFVLTRSVIMPKLFDLDASAGRWAVRYDQAFESRLAAS